MKTPHSREKDLETAAVLAAAALVFYLIFRKDFLAVTALGLLGLGLFFKKAAAGLSRGWLAFAEKLGKFNTAVILTAIYYLFLVPVAFLARLFNGRRMLTRRSPGAESYFTRREYAFTREDFEKTW